MNTSSFVTPGVLASVQGLWRWFTATPEHRQSLVTQTRQQPREFNVNSVTNNGCSGTTRRCAVGSLSVGRPVRIIRVLEASQAPTQAGRMVMSGRMEDVCAELDRLAAKETALH